MTAPFDALSLASRFGGQVVLVVGDVMLDRYWWGSVTRISPEAPVPVVRKSRSSIMPGGAANAAANLAALGGRVTLVGVMGDDDAGRELRRALTAAALDPSQIVTDAGRPTTVKTRIVAHHQHVVRVDEESSTPLAEPITRQVIERVDSALSGAQALLLSDYAKGVLTDPVLKTIIQKARARRIPIVVDPKGQRFERYGGASVITPNRAELSSATGLAVTNHAETMAAAHRLRTLLDGTAILATEGEEGMTLVREGMDPMSLPTQGKRVFDVTGAGDTVVATMTMALALGSSLVESAVLANRAAGLAVEQVGTVAVSKAMLVDALRADLESQP